MTVEVSVRVTIARPRPEVAAFMFNPRNDMIWTTGVVEVHPQQPGPLRTGARVERVSKFLGRRMSYLIEVTDAAEESYVQMHATMPFEMNVRYELQDAAEGTIATITTRGGGTGFFRIAAPILNKMVERSVRNDLETLKTYLDAGADLET